MVCLSFFLFCSFISFPLATFVWAGLFVLKKSFCYNSEFLILGLSLSFFFGGGGLLLFFALAWTRGLESLITTRDEYCLHLCNIYRLVGGIRNALYILVCASFLLPCFIVSMATCLSFFGD